jgi:hypothetical protein
MACPAALEQLLTASVEDPEVAFISRQPGMRMRGLAAIPIEAAGRRHL